MKAILLATMAGLCWGIGELCTKSVLHTHRVGPVTAIAVRSAVALPVIWAAWLVAVYVLKLKEEPTDWLCAGAPTLLKLVLGSGLVAGALAMILFYSALNAGDISVVKPIAFTI